MYSSLIVVYLYSSVVQLRARVCVCVHKPAENVCSDVHVEGVLICMEYEG